MIKNQKILKIQPTVIKMDITHKHRKGFREDAEVLAEAYSNIYKEEKEQLEEGLLSTGAGALLGGAVGGIPGAVAGGVLGHEVGKSADEAETEAEDQEIGEDAAGSPNAIHDVLEKVYEISGRLHGEIEDLGIFLPQEHSKRWTKLEELQKELESVVDEYGDDKFWAARQEDRKYSAEPRGGYHEW